MEGWLQIHEGGLETLKACMTPSFREFMMKLVQGEDILWMYFSADQVKEIQNVLLLISNVKDGDRRALSYIKSIGYDIIILDLKLDISVSGGEVYVSERDHRYFNEKLAEVLFTNLFINIYNRLGDKLGGH
jgi:hypothetical protein